LLDELNHLSLCFKQVIMEKIINWSFKIATEWWEWTLRM